jgi:hopanoid C-3 methylase
MRVLLVHPSPLMYSEIYLRLEPLGLERIGAALREAGHEVRLLDLQIVDEADYLRTSSASRSCANGRSACRRSCT